MSEVERTEMLVPLDRLQPVELFTEENLEGLLEEIRAAATSIVADPSTNKGRDEIKSVAYRIARTKTTLDAMGKALVDPLKAQAGEIDALRRRAKTTLENLQAEVREPVTKYEQALADADAKILYVRNLAGFVGSPTSEQIQSRIDELNGITTRGFLKSMKDELQTAIDETGPKLAQMLEDRQKIEAFEKQQKEDRQREEEAARQQREEEIARQAAEQGAENERKRREEEEAKKKAEDEARAKDRKHRGEINSKAAADLMEKCSLSDEDARAVVEAIVRNRISHISITY